MNDYIGNPLQLRGAEQYVLQNGKGDGMRFLYVRNGLGLDAWISLDRCGDLSRVVFKGDNLGFFAPCGYVAPQYYDGVGFGFLKSFTAGFFTTCGLTAVGDPCTDEGEDLPLHGTISNTPAERFGFEETEDGLSVTLTVRDASLGGRKLVLRRGCFFSYRENSVTVSDRVTNEGDAESPYMLLYHCNMAYPLLDEHAEVRIPNHGVSPRNEHAAATIADALKPEKPQAGFEESCFYYDVAETNGKAHAGVFNPGINKGVVLEYGKKALPYFTEWKQMGKTDYVLGLEPGNCTPDGRDVLRKRGTLRFLQPGETGETSLTFRFADGKTAFDAAF